EFIKNVLLVATGFLGGFLTYRLIQQPSQQTLHFSKDEEKPITDPYKNERLKMVLVVRTDLKMSVGKIGAQCGHAALGSYTTIVENLKRDKQSSIAKLHYMWANRWEENGAAKIVLRTNSLESM